MLEIITLNQEDEILQNEIINFIQNMNTEKQKMFRAFIKGAGFGLTLNDALSEPQPLNT